MSGAERATFELVRNLTVPARNPRGTREGYTTGACAAAAAHAACRVLLRDERPVCVRVPSPLGFDLEIPINRLAYDRGVATAGVIKDGGDDPDVTHGAEVIVTVRRITDSGIHIKGGVGVGTVTQPGLELPPGSPAINPVPRQMIIRGIEDALGSERPREGIEVVVSVPEGEKLAKKTLNARLGIVDGLSILGTTGIVRPMSTASWRASVVQAIDVAAANCLGRIVLTTGGRSERFAEAVYPDLPEMAFVQMGIFARDALKRCVSRGIAQVSVCGMIGKIAKLAAGQMQTHVAGGAVDLHFLGELAREVGADEALAREIALANTARHVEEIVRRSSFPGLYNQIAVLAARSCSSTAGHAVEVELIMFDFAGNVLARAIEPRRHEERTHE
jgi:cobalt-precorrin-5B (C1)-methyltransferase